MSWIRSHVALYAVPIAALLALAVALHDQASAVADVERCNFGMTPMSDRLGFLIALVTVVPLAGTGGAIVAWIAIHTSRLTWYVTLLVALAATAIYLVVLSETLTHVVYASQLVCR